LFLPLKDENPTRHVAWMTVALLAANGAAFVLQLTAASPSAFVAQWGFVPAAQTAERLTPLLTAMFLHGGVLHLGGNLLYLWIFGNNVEDLFGPVRFLVFYLACGLAGHAAHYLSNPASTVPTIGASGAISGVLAAYLLRFPRASIVSVVFLFVFIRLVRVPAALVIAFWLLLQVVYGAASLAGGPAGGVAWFEHLGGFGAGLLLTPMLARGRRW
jgi:membrane associated rhomboid family serine protease